MSVFRHAALDLPHDLPDEINETRLFKQRIRLDQNFKTWSSQRSQGSSSRASIKLIKPVLKEYEPCSNSKQEGSANYIGPKKCLRSPTQELIRDRDFQNLKTLWGSSDHQLQSSAAKGPVMQNYCVEKVNQEWCYETWVIASHGNRLKIYNLQYGLSFAFLPLFFAG